MAFFDKLSQVAKNIGDMAGDTIETTKLNAQAAKENAQALEQVAKIGDFYYKQYLAGAELAPEVQEFCQMAKTHYDAAAAAQAEVERIKAENGAAKNAAPATAAPTAGGAVSCPNCGAQFPAGTKFCNNCGTAVG